MEQYISKSALVAEIERRKQTWQHQDQQYVAGGKDVCDYLLGFLNTLEVKDPYEQCIQYSSIEEGIKAHAEDYSWNIESELFHQLTPEQQKLWRKEIEQACISGGYSGLNLAKDPRYKENLEVKEVDLDEEINNYFNRISHFGKIHLTPEYDNIKVSTMTIDGFASIAKHFFELGMRVNNPITAADRGIVDEIMFALNALGKEKMISYGKEIEWLRNKVKKGE